MNYSEGDKVRVKSIQWYTDNSDEQGHVCYGNMLVDFIPQMIPLCGKVATIEIMSMGGIFWLKGCPHMFCAEMVDPVLNN